MKKKQLKSEHFLAVMTFLLAIKWQRPSLLPSFPHYFLIFFLVGHSYMTQYLAVRVPFSWCIQQEFQEHKSEWATPTELLLSL